MRQLSSRLFAFCSKCVFPLSARPSLPFAHFHLPLVGDAANQPPPHSDPVHHVRVIRGHASSGEPPQRHCLQLRPRADQRHGTTHRHTHTHKKTHTNCHMHCLHLWHQRNRECQVSELNYIIGSLDFSTLPWKLSSVWPLTFSLSSPGESRVWGEPDRRGGGDVGHHHLGCSALQPDWVPSLGSGQERHRQLITTDGTATRRDRRTAERPIGEMRNCFREERRRERYVPRRGFLFRCEPPPIFF